jgi:hypothetical protein
MSDSDRQEKYLSIYCRCCGNQEGARNISPTDVAACQTYQAETCKCPVREETGNAWWNFWGRNYQARWNDSCSNKIPERAGIVPPAGDPDTLPTAIAAPNTGGSTTDTTPVVVGRNGGN